MSFKFLQNFTVFYAVNWTFLLSYCALGFVREHGVLTRHVTSVRTIHKYVFL